MSENTTPERIDLAGLIEQMESAHEYQRHLEAKNWGLTADLAEVRADYGDLVENRDAFARRVQELERERDGLNRDQTELAARVDELKAQLANQDTVPRVITAEELRHGMVVAVADHGEYGLRWEATMALDTNLALFEGKPRIVLLEDAPAEEPEPVKVGDEISTEEQVEALPRRTILRGCEGDAFERGSDGWWMAGGTNIISSPLVIRHAPVTVLYLP